MNTSSTNKLKTMLVTLSLIIVSGTALADGDGEGKQKQRRGAPPEAIEACRDLNEGDACQFDGRRGEVSGTCFVPPKDDAVLACKPKRHKQQG